MWELQGICTDRVCTKEDIAPLVILFAMVLVVLAIGFFVMNEILDYISGVSGDKVKRWLVF